MGTSRQSRQSAHRLAALGIALLTGAAGAQTYPSKLIRVINPSAPGGNSDLLFRTLSPKMVEILGQQLVMAQYTFVAYKGSHQALIDVMAGHIQFQFSSISNLLPYVQAGKLNLLAQTGDKRSPSAAHVPTMEESGMPGFVVRSPFSFLAPAGLSRPVVEKLNGALVTSLHDPAAHKSLVARGADPVGNTPDEHTAFLRTEIEKWIKVAREAGITAE